MVDDFAAELTARTEKGGDSIALVWNGKLFKIPICRFQNMFVQIGKINLGLNILLFSLELLRLGLLNREIEFPNFHNIFFSFPPVLFPLRPLPSALPPGVQDPGGGGGRG